MKKMIFDQLIELNNPIKIMNYHDNGVHILDFTKEIKDQTNINIFDNENQTAELIKQKMKIIDSISEKTIYIWYQVFFDIEETFIEELRQSLIISRKLKLIPMNLNLYKVADCIWYIMKLVKDLEMFYYEDAQNMIMKLQEHYQNIVSTNKKLELTLELVKQINPLIKYQEYYLYNNEKTIIYIPFNMSFFPGIANIEGTIKYFMYFLFKKSNIIKPYDIKTYMECFEQALEAKKSKSVENDLILLRKFNLDNLQKILKNPLSKQNIKIFLKLQDVKFKIEEIVKCKIFTDKSTIDIINMKHKYIVKNMIDSGLRKVIEYRTLENYFNIVQKFIKTSSNQQKAIICFLLNTNAIFDKMSEQDIKDSKIIKLYHEIPNLLKIELIFLFNISKNNSNLVKDFLQMSKKNKYELNFEKKILYLTQDECIIISKNYTLLLNSSLYNKLEAINHFKYIYDNLY